MMLSTPVALMSLLAGLGVCCLVTSGAPAYYSLASSPEDARANEDQSVPVGRKCEPILDLAAYLNGSAFQQQQSRNNNNGQQRIALSVGDIEVPITPNESTLNSALRLLSSLSNPFEGALGDSMENLIRFSSNKLNVQAFNVTMLNVHLYQRDQPRFALGITLRNASMTGQFDYEGPLALTEGRLAGFYNMSIDTIYLAVSSNLTKTSGDGSRLHTNDLRLNITNLGYISIDIFDSLDEFGQRQPSSSYVLRILQRLLQKTIKRTYYLFEEFIRDSLERETRRSFDCELTRFSPYLQEAARDDQNSANVLLGDTKLVNNGDLGSDFARILGSEIARSNMGSVSLPNFEHQQSILGTQARINFFNGSLAGLNNIRLPGETKLKLQEEHLFANTSIGWHDLMPYYEWSLTVGGGGELVNNSNRILPSKIPSSSQKAPITRGFVSFAIKAIDFDSVITKGLRPGSRFVVDQLVISRLEQPKMDIGGLPGMNRLTRVMVNFFMGRLKQRVSNSIQPVLKHQFERALNKASFKSEEN